MSKKTLDVLFHAWGWITPGTGTQHRASQLQDYLAFFRQKPPPAARHMLFNQCGWWLDCGASRAVRDLTARNPEPHRHLSPCGRKTLALFRRYGDAGRFEFVNYPYAACVAEATTGEGLLRTHRMGLDLAEKTFGLRPRVTMNHDAPYLLEWGAVQMPQIARMLGVPMLMAYGNGTVSAPDGTRVRFIGGEGSTGEILQGAVDLRRPHLWVFELHGLLSFLREMEEGKDPMFSLVNFGLRGTALDGFLRKAGPWRRDDSRRMGTKGWYGGTIDSLLQEQNAKSIEMRLPAVEALAVLSGARNLRGVKRQLDDLWKKSFILMDNHTLWQCHNYKAHYLPQSFKAMEELLGIERRLLPAAAQGPRAVVFNPVPWRRDIAVSDGHRTLLAKGVPGWGAAVVDRSKSAATLADEDPFTLANDLVSYRLNRPGEVVAIRSADGVRALDGLNRLLRIHENRTNETRRLRVGETLEGIEGSLSAETETPIRGWRTPSVSFTMEDCIGGAFLLQCDRLREDGALIATESVPLHSLHWGGAGMPHHSIRIGPKKLNSWGARRLRIRLWMLAEGRVRFGRARVWTHSDQDDFREVREWKLRVRYRNAYTTPVGTRAQVLRSDAAMKTVRFTGELPDLEYRMDLSLRAGSAALECALNLHFPRPTCLGLSSPPFSEDDGSMLGAQCERPYVPGVAVLLPLHGRARYYSDKPYYLQECFLPARHTWHTDQQDWWLGMSAFIGMNLAVADDGRSQLGLLTRGIKHFFRWKRGGAESLGLSLGASIIHQQTQGHSAPPGSPLYEVIKRTNHDPYFETRFLRAQGDYEFHYAICPARSGEKGRFNLWRAAQEFALPLQAFSTGAPEGVASAGISTTPARVVVSAMEPTGDELALRIVNMGGTRAKACVTLPFGITQARMPDVKERVRFDGRRLRLNLPPWAVREVRIRRQFMPARENRR